MVTSDTAIEVADPTGSQGSSVVLGIGAVLGGLAVSACCVLPLVFVVIGVGGSWMSTLIGFGAYKFITIPLTLLMLGIGFYFAYRKPKVATCNPDGTCGTPRSNRIARTLLWVGAAIAVIGIGFPYAAPLFY
ncbi:MAG: mercuric transporter MerT family protein [Cognatishimia sp.]|uniref:mercuric transporter MerT family protein n=1 Tax=Cognatishimia sp. TaxID=2211648 RepID=UPI0040591768